MVGISITSRRSKVPDRTPYSQVGLAPGVSIVNGQFMVGGKPYTQQAYNQAQNAFTPYTPPPTPTGSYDPAIDAQIGATQRGLGDTLTSLATQRSRLTTDYGLGQDAINRGASRGLADLTQSRDRGIGQLDTSGARAEQDYQSALGNLQRSYQRLGNQQQQQQNAYGVLRGGAALQAAAKRAANQQLDQQPLDTSIGRTRQDIGTQRSQLLQDFGTQSGRLTEDQNLQLGQLALSSAPPDANNPVGGRSWQDLLTQGTQAQREASQFGLDAQAQKDFQAAQGGYVAPQRGEKGGSPSNEFVDASGNHYRVVIHGNQKLYYDPSGKLIKKVAR